MVAFFFKQINFVFVLVGMDRNYYKLYYRLERDHWWFAARGKMLMNHLKNLLAEKTNLKILNVGVATGRTSELLQQFGEVISIEFDEECCAFTNEVVKIPVQQGSILELPFQDNQFDLVCSFDVIEHVEDDHLAASELERVCKHDGIICATVPAFQFLWSQHDVVNHHYRRYTRTNFLKLFHSELIYSSYFNFLLFFPIATFRLLTSWIKGNKNTSNKTDSEIEMNPIINKLMYRVFYLENYFLKNRLRLPVGVSIIATFKKNRK